MVDDAGEGMILLDVSSGGNGFDRELLERFGHAVKVCHGPDHATLCPLLAGKGCADFEQAHGVLFELDLDRPQHRAILRRYRELARPDVPIRAIVTTEQATRYADELRDIEVLTHDPSVADLDGFASQVEAVDRA
ncbi:MAG TPA: hypothetical protein VIK61_12700 [Acidimicrobiia bacterium]